MNPNANIGCLFVVGSGLQLNHITIGTKSHIEKAEKVLYLVADPVTEQWIKTANSTSESLSDCYTDGKDRLKSYQEMIDRIIGQVEQGKYVVAVFYGHPGVFVNPSHRVISLARSKGFEATMLPGISAEDCLFSDLGIDPSVNGCQSFEATDFLLYERKYDAKSAMILWQIGVIGNLKFARRIQDNAGVELLRDYLSKTYPQDHEVTIYEAAQYVIAKPRIDKVALQELADKIITPISTLFIPAHGAATPSKTMADRLDIAITYKNAEQGR